MPTRRSLATPHGSHPWYRSWRKLRSYRRRAILGLLSAWAIVTVGCTSTLFQPGASPDVEIRIGIIATLSGESSYIGHATVQASQLAADEINQAGGLEVGNQRYPITLVIENDQDEVDTAINAARKLIYQDNVVAIVGPQYSRNAIPVANVVESAQIVMISPRSTNPETTAGKRYIFRATFIDPFQGQVMAQFAHDELQAQTAAVLYDIASPYHQGIADVFKQVFTEVGGKIVAFESYTTGASDFSEQLERIHASNADVFFLPSYKNEIVQQVSQARQVGIQATLLGADGWGSLQTSELQNLDGAFFSDQYSPDLQNPLTQQFIQNYRQAYGEDPEANAAATYDTLHLLFRAIQAQAETDADSIRQGLSDIGKYEGVTGSIEYRGTGDPVKSVVILQIKDGQSVFYTQVDP